MKISIIDYGAGNLPSVERAVRGLGAETECVTRPEQIAAARVLILPGVGHFSAFVTGLRERNLTSALRQALAGGTPILGICLGLQAMFAASAEAPGERGLDLIHENVQALPTKVKSPTSAGISCGACAKAFCCATSQTTPTSTSRIPTPQPPASRTPPPRAITVFLSPLSWNKNI